MDNNLEYSNPVVVHSRALRKTEAQFLISESIRGQALAESPSENRVIDLHLVLKVHILEGALR
jgi:hypothetical protein